MGTHNKMFDYTHNPYRELVVGMSRALAQAHSVIVAGYGFHDKAINSQLIGWFYANSDRKLVVVNPGFDDLKKQASPAIRRLLNNSKELDHLKLIENKFENVSWDEIVKYI